MCIIQKDPSAETPENEKHYCGCNEAAQKVGSRCLYCSLHGLKVASWEAISKPKGTYHFFICNDCKELGQAIGNDHFDYYPVKQ